MGRGDKIAEAWINSDERRLFHGAWRWHPCTPTLCQYGVNNYLKVDAVSV